MNSCQCMHCRENRLARLLCITVAVIAGIVTLALCGGGCAHYEYGPASVKSFGVDPTVESFDWAKATTNADGVVIVEAISVRGFRRTGGEAGTHMLGNVASTMIGALCGSAIGPGGTAAGAAHGAAIGFSGGEVWQTVKDWVGKKTGGATPSSGK